LAEQDDEWQIADRRYFSAASMEQIGKLEGGEIQKELLAADRLSGEVAMVKSPPLDGTGPLNAKEADLLNLGLPPGSFDAVYSTNCFLRVPNAKLPDARKALPGP
jgi:hypothetical protein